MKIYDTTMRDGTQSREVNMTVSDKLSLLEELDRSCIDYAELGWPGSNPKDMETFIKASKLPLKHIKISAFCSTRRVSLKPEEDPNLKAVIESKAPAVSMFGKTWIDHIEKQLKATPEQNIESIKDSVEFLKSKGLEVFYDAEHFFDGYKDNKKYAVKCIKTAHNAGADAVILCETNGGCLPGEIKDIVEELKQSCPDVKLGMHCHNDSGCAVANTLICAEDMVQIQGTLNGFGERTGNADLCQVIPGLELKKKIKTNFKLEKLRELSNLAYILTNTNPKPSQPYVGKNAFAHKGGIHVDALNKGAVYEHIKPEKVGNKRNIILSDLSGSANVVEVLKSFGIEADKKDERVKNMLNELKEMEKKGYEINDIDAEKFLLSMKYFGNYEGLDEAIDWKNWEVTTGKRDGREHSKSWLTGTINDKNYDVVSRVDDNGPVDSAFRSLKKFFSYKDKQINDVELTNFKVMIAENKGAESSVRVYIEFKNKNENFATIGVNENIIEASIEAIYKAFSYHLLKTEEK